MVVVETVGKCLEMFVVWEVLPHMAMSVDLDH